MKISIRELSKLTGFSPATISNALNHKKGVNRATAEEIFRVAREAGYFSDAEVRKITFLVFKKNGLIVEDGAFFQKVIEGAEKECRRLGYEMEICRADQRAADYEEQVRELLKRTETAVVVLATEMTDGDLELYRNASCTVVLLDYWSDNMEFSAVLADNADGARILTDYLLDNGHREIGYIRSSFRIKNFRSRFAGFQTALKKRKILFQEKYMVMLGTIEESAFQDMMQYLKKKPELPTAFFIENHVIARGAMRALQKMGYSIPEDVSIVVFGNVSCDSDIFPLPAAMEVPDQELGRVGIKLVVELIEREETSISAKVQLCPCMQYRQTVRKI